MNALLLTLKGRLTNIQSTVASLPTLTAEAEALRAEISTELLKDVELKMLEVEALLTEVGELNAN